MIRRFLRRLFGRRDAETAATVEIASATGLVEDPDPEWAEAPPVESVDDVPVEPVALPALLFAGADEASLYANCVYLSAPAEFQQVLVMLDEAEARRWFANAHGLFELERERRRIAAAPLQQATALAHLTEALRARHVPPSGVGAGAAGLRGAGNGFGDVRAVRPLRRRRTRPGGPF